jgi:predicted MFS family arabinose efflux permease
VIAPFVGIYLESIGRKRAIVIGLVIMVLATVLFAVAPHFKTPYAFFACAFTGRLI